MDIQVGVSLEAEARDDEVAAVRAAFVEAGIDARVEADLELRGAGGQFPWMVVLAVPAAQFLNAFLSEAGKDGYKNLKLLIQRLYDARKAARAPKGGITLVDEETSTWINLPPDLPHEALQQLSEVDLKELPSGTLRWDSKTGRWRDAWDED